MKLFYTFLLILFSQIITLGSAEAKINIFACEPEWASLAQEIGGDKLDIFTATHAKQDVHYIRARPSLIAKARYADLIFCSGAGLEVGWLPLLLERANSNVQIGRQGYFMASQFVPILEKPIIVDRSMGDIHPQGNPHIHLNPYNITLITHELTKRLSIIDPDNKDFYQAQSILFLDKWKDAIKQWEQTAKKLADKSVIVHHRSFSYLLDWLNITQVGSLEPKPGIPPNIAHLETLLTNFKTQPANFIIRAPHEPEKASLWLSDKTKIPAIMLPFTIGGDPQSNHLFALFDRTLALLQKSLIHSEPHADD